METNQISKGRLWTSRVLSGLAILFMLSDSIFKFFPPDEVVKGTTDLGYGEHHLLPIGILGFVSTLLYIIPRTSVLGALLLTGYFGGAMATHFRLDNPLFSHILFPVYLALLIWGGLWLRNENLRKLVPLKNDKVRA
ncbi:DoxX-like protein [Anseongella ginsenosidimutans]|uniref:DoxX-like protein n=1 Tax=Anseongella ginsenosidimutans TaxID=496056 RepID=A0A4V2UU58_9SPHI|nr:DoxX family protein [Anseongella ginsenosidimutans]QEC51848.1 DoxX family protein [Anseongella ginsenosidimutans]TCS89223.1 DoxX-like protein [Anseongella ginsenosidimutans]